MLGAVKGIFELTRKYKVLRDKNLLGASMDSVSLEKYLYACAYIGRHQGFIRSMKEGMCVAADGEPIPWYTYPAIEQLSRWNFAGSTVFEYGCGNSTRWWAKRAKSVVSVENSRGWYERILSSNSLPENVTPILREIDSSTAPDPAQVESYVHAIDQYGEFDVIVIDGFSPSRTRLACTQVAMAHLSKGGMIILDNSDWHPESARVLREAGFLEIDFCGIGPLNTMPETTSLFLSKDFAVAPLHAKHPGYVKGGQERDLG